MAAAYCIDYLQKTDKACLQLACLLAQVLSHTDACPGLQNMEQRYDAHIYLAVMF